MTREFISATLGRAVHEEIFRQLLQHNAAAAADAMEMTYDQDDLRVLQAIHTQLDGLTSDEARELLQGMLQQPQHVFGSPQRLE